MLCEEGQHKECKEAGVFQGRARGSCDFSSGSSFSAWAVSCPVGTALRKGLTAPPVSTWSVCIVIKNAGLRGLPSETSN